MVCCGDIGLTLLRKLFPALGTVSPQQFTLAMNLLKNLVTGSLKEECLQREDQIRELANQCRVFVLQNQISRLFSYLYMI